MKNIEEQIWKYVSGEASVADRKELEHLLEADPACRILFEEIKALHTNLQALTPDEPSMGFHRNLMDKIALEPNPNSVSSVDKRIILSISAFFMLSIGASLAYVFYQSEWTSGSINFSVPAINWHHYFNRQVIIALLMLEMVLGLYFLDYFLRRNMNQS